MILSMNKTKPARFRSMAKKLTDLGLLRRLGANQTCSPSVVRKQEQASVGGERGFRAVAAQGQARCGDGPLGDPVGLRPRAIPGTRTRTGGSPPAAAPW